MNDDQLDVGAPEKRNANDAAHEEPMPEGEEAVPRGVKLMAALRWAILGLAALLAVGSWWVYARAGHAGSPDGAATAQAATKFHCPMHPQIIADEPGECPICHMQLEPFVPASSSLASSASSVEAGAATPHASRSDAGNEGHTRTAPGGIPPATAPLQLTLDRVQAIGVRTAVATEKPLAASQRVTAIVAPTDEGAAEVHVRTPCFIESIRVNQIGVHVARGEWLLSVYSPEVYQAESELLATRQWTGDAGARSQEGARRKLELLGMSKTDIAKVALSGEAIRAMPVYAPAPGTITKKAATLGAYATPETMLYAIEDLSRVYVIADVFQQDIGAVHVGAVGTFRTEGGGTALEARVDLIYPSVDANARTTRVRMSVRNESGALRPGQFGTVEIATGARPRNVVTVPRDAVIDNGLDAYVFVVDGPGKLTPRAVAVGGDLGGDVVITAGLAAGERVVSGATFLIDSESRLQASALQAAERPVPPPANGKVDPSAGPSCTADFDRTKYPDKFIECQKCGVHQGMGSMESDCKNAIGKPWR